MRVLIVDDSPGIRFKLRHMMEDLGHTVAGEAANGSEAVTFFKDLEPDLVTMDIVMPLMDGLSALREIMKLDPNAKVIMVTSAATTLNQSEALSAGATNFIMKPFEKDKIIAALDAVVKNK